MLSKKTGQNLSRQASLVLPRRSSPSLIIHSRLTRDQSSHRRARSSAILFLLGRSANRVTWVPRRPRRSFCVIRCCTETFKEFSAYAARELASRFSLNLFFSCIVFSAADILRINIFAVHRWGREDSVDCGLHEAGSVACRPGFDRSRRQRQRLPTW